MNAPLINPWDIPGINNRLVELHADKNLSMREIADRLAFEFEVELTRNAIIGRCRRVGLPTRPTGTPRPPIIPAQRKPPLRIDAPIVPEPEPVIGRLTIYQLRHDTCRFVLGELADRPPYLFCGEPSNLGCSWCPTHYRTVYGRPQVPA